MASQQQEIHRAGFPGEDEDLDEDDDDVLDEDDANSASTSSSLPTATPVAPISSVTVAVPSSSLVLNGADPLPTSSIPSSSASAPVAVIATPVPLRMETTPPDSRKLFQRLWTDEDEIELLQGFLEFTSQRSTGGVPAGPGHHDTTLFYDQIKSKLQLDFNKNQLIEKLRRLKKKYRNVLNKISSGKDVSFKSPHDRATFEISRKIWPNLTASRGPHNETFDEDDDNNDNNTSFSLNPNFASPSPNFSSPNPNPNPNSRPIYEAILLPTNPRKRPRSQAQPVKVEEKAGGAASDGPAGLNGVTVSSGVSGIIEETVRSCLSPLFKELLNGSMMGSGGAFAGIAGIPAPFNLNSPSLLNFGGLPLRGYGVEAGDERWRKQQILELEVYSKRLELVQEQIRAKLDELRSGR
ncbi:probable transcription factor At3g04930 [Punica granatum]|uniref:Glabrous enhancer-binding protein-like DBD domain-containing protein n=2 Tax=Punica granatum TaxID=22663 RepID=A0A218VSV5_PUNGR|nr:probable transcription factor At3g04930 [Punica granatum]OWM63002.1 hypothetical protein CDL15_Pgr020296 [Punica granatum]PKI67939.1 hypothetical protein CRG98_011535 [Punica granatum]